jgi:phospholipid/cholesterol/gamma-HCH transport system substrate-binding protein
MTSLLGEHFVDLRLPTQYDAVRGPFLRSGDDITQTRVEPQFEDITQQAANVIGAIGVNDVSTLLRAASQGFGGRGEELNNLIAKLSTVAQTLGDQRANIAAAIDGLGRFGASLAAGSDQVGTLIGDVDGVTVSLAQNREKIVAALAALTRAGQDMNDVVLVPHTRELSTMLAQLDPIVATLAQSKLTLESLITNLMNFNSRIDNATFDEALLVWIWHAGFVPANQPAP